MTEHTRTVPIPPDSALARALDQESVAMDRFRAVVVDYADQARAPGALDALVDMGRALREVRAALMCFVLGVAMADVRPGRAVGGGRGRGLKGADQPAPA